MIACFKTSLSEEILFRGFIAKRLIAKLGYQRGNILQATIFGLIHLALFLALIGPQLPFLIGIFVFSGLAGYIMQHINEKHSAGSIIPGWLAHGFGNTVSYLVIAFLM